MLTVVIVTIHLFGGAQGICPASVPFENIQEAEQWMTEWTLHLDQYWGDQLPEGDDMWGDCISSDDIIQIIVDGEELTHQEAADKSYYIRSKSDPEQFGGVNCVIKTVESYKIVAEGEGIIDLPTPIIGNDNMISFKTTATFEFDENGYLTKYLIVEDQNIMGQLLKYFIPNDPINNNKPIFVFGQHELDSFDCMVLLLLLLITLFVIFVSYFVIRIFCHVKGKWTLYQYTKVNQIDGEKDNE